MLASYENILVFRPEKQSILTLFQLEDGIFQLERLLGNWKKIILPNWQLEKNHIAKLAIGKKFIGRSLCAKASTAAVANFFNRASRARPHFRTFSYDNRPVMH